MLKDELTKEELENLKKSYDIIGSKEGAVAIIEVPEELEHKKVIIARAVKDTHKNIDSVIRKTSERKGKYRIKDYEILIDGKKEVIHKECGYRLKLDPTKVYFSPREERERMRIADQVEEGERILVMFGGIAAFPIAMARNKRVEITSIEINPEGHKYAEENIRINKLKGEVEAVEGDVNDICPGLGKFDRILMPLPKRSDEFLYTALGCLKKGGILHFYFRGRDPEPFSEAEKKLKDATEGKVKILRKKRVLPYGPRIWKVCIDAEVY